MLTLNHGSEEEREMIALAYAALNKHYRVLAPASEAKVIFCEFNPFRAVQPIAIVEWPAIVAMREVVLTHVICDGQAS